MIMQRQVGRCGGASDSVITVFMAVGIAMGGGVAFFTAFF